MVVNIPSPLRSYTANRSQVEGNGSSLAEVLSDLDRRFPGMRFRMIDEQDGIRPHIKLFVNQDQASALTTLVSPSDEIHIICALSGG